MKILNHNISLRNLLIMFFSLIRKESKLQLINKKDIKSITTDTIDETYKASLFENRDLIEEILKHNCDLTSISSEEERAFPGNRDFINSGYYNIMLKRYFFAGKFFCRDLDVIDTCCGLGWGTYIISKFAKRVVSFDLNHDVIRFCQENWRSSNIIWKYGDCMDLSFISDMKFDVALAMETIEHFSKEDGDRYIKSVSNIIKENGILIGTSAFPESNNDASILCNKNKYHKHIFTYKEITKILSKYFRQHIIINSWMFIAEK